MTHFGKIKSYDSNKGAGVIVPEKGGEPMAFAKADLQQQAQEPKVDQRYAYETSNADGGTPKAINLQQEQEQEQEKGQHDQGSQQQG